MRPKPAVRHLVPSRPGLPLALALRRRPRLRWALAAAAAAVLGLLVAGAVNRAERARAAWGRTQTVLVATHDLAAGLELEAGDTEARTVPVAAAPRGAVTSAPAGRVVRLPVLGGEVLVRGRLAGTGVTGVAALLPHGTRAVAIPTEPGTAPPLRVGQRVDVVAVAAGSDGAVPGFVLARAAPVVDVREQAASVAVDPDAVPRIAVALAEGAVSLALVAP
jgi:Flp pilus assembly protein CpaB